MKSTMECLVIALVAVIGFSFIACGDGGGGGDGPGGGGHTHTYSTTWSSNATQHWRECTANDGAETARANHTFSGNICSVCNYNSGGGDTGGPTNWTAVSNSTFDTSDHHIYAIAYGIADGESVGRFVAGGFPGKMAYSTNGSSWTSVSDSKFGTFTIHDIAYGNNRFVAVGDDGQMAYCDW
jgi:hypothetical protein